MQSQKFGHAHLNEEEKIKISLILQRTCEANGAGENSSFVFTVKSVALYHFKLVYLVLYIWLSKNFWKPTAENGEIGGFDPATDF